MTLPTTKQTRASKTPLDVRVLLAGMPKSGKTTLASAWAPDTTLIIDTQHGTDLLEGEHYVAHVSNWVEFVQVVDDLCAGGHQFKTVSVDLIDDVWSFADQYFAGKGAVLASATDDWQRSINTAEGMFRQMIGKLLAAPLGVWFVSHTREKKDGDLTRYVPKLDQRVYGYVQGACEVILIAEQLGPRRQLRTQISAKFEAGTRIPLPEPFPLDAEPYEENARRLYAAMAKGLSASKVKPKQAQPSTTHETTQTEPQEALAA